MATACLWANGYKDLHALLFTMYNTTPLGLVLFTSIALHIFTYHILDEISFFFFIVFFNKFLMAKKGIELNIHFHV